MIEEIQQDAKERMSKSIEALKNNLNKIVKYHFINFTLYFDYFETFKFVKTK